MANDPHLPAPLAPAAERLQAFEHAVEAAVGQAIEATEQSLARRFGSGCVRALRRGLTLLLWSLVAAYFVFGALLLATRYWVMPRIDEARPWLERQVAAALKTEVRIGRIEAGWQGFNPRLLLSDVRLHAGGGQRLALPQVEAVVSWASVPRLGLRFASLSVLAPELEVRRLAPARFEVAGFAIEPAPAAGSDSALLDWLLAQHRVSVRDARILYVDQTGAEPQAHRFSDVNLVLEGGFHALRFALQARPPAELAGLIDLRGDFERGWLQRAADISQWRGRLFAQFEFADLALIESLARVLPPPHALASAQGALRLWIEVDRSRLQRASADVALVDVDATLGGDLQPLRLVSLRGRVTQREWGNLFEGGQELALTGFSLQGPQLDLPPTDLRWRHTRADDGERNAGRDDGGVDPRDRRLQKTEIEASSLSLDTLSTLALHVPLARDLRQLVEKHAVRGTLSSLRLAVEGPLDQPLRYAARSRFSGLSMQAQPADPPTSAAGYPRPGLPGFDNLAGSVELTEHGGTLMVDARDAALEFPGVFEQPELSFERLTAQLRWNRADGRIDAWLDSLAAANADLELSAAGHWRRDGAGPGSIDLSGRLQRIEVAAVPGYLPLVVGPKARAWLQRALVAGRGSDGSFRLRGDLREFPFRDPRSGEFRIAARVRDAVLDYLPAAPREDGGLWPAWPRIEKIDADVVFERQRMQITARSAQVYGARLAPVSALIADLGNRDARLQLKGAASGPAADMLRFVADSPLRERLPVLAGATASGTARLELGLEIPLAHGRDTEVDGNLLLQNNDIALRAGIPPFARASGRIDFTRNSLRLAGINAGFVGGLARIDGATRPDGALAISATGSATPAGVRRAVEVGIVQRLLARASGSTRYAGTLVLRNGRPELRIDTDLSGWAIDAPAPLGKSSSELLPLRVELLPMPGSTAGATPERDAIRVTAGSLLNVRFERVRDPGGDLRIERGVVAVGEDVPLPARGVLAHVNLPRVDADAWLPLLDTDAPPAGGARAASALDAGGMPEFLTLRTRELLIAGKPVANVVAGATRAREGGETVWQANVVSDHVSGALTWRPATAGGSGRVSARLARLTIPEAQRSNVAQILEAPPSEVPGFDVVADSFELGGRQLGRLELVASNVPTAAGPAWVMQKLEISNPEARMSATGQWQREPGSPQRRMALTLQIDFSNAGALLARLGIPDALKGGQGQLEGELAWRGSPFAIHYPTLAGQLKLATSKGQFLKADAGAGRLLGVLSLQSLPRRISLDFRDVFSEGFAFDSIGASAAIKGGVLSTTDLRMRGVSANVLIEGSIDLRNETQNLHVLVLPEVNAGSASLVYALMANPAIGLGTFLAQMLLRDPLSKAFSFEYDVTGSWADPQVRRRERTVPEATAPGGN